MFLRSCLATIYAMAMLSFVPAALGVDTTFDDGNSTGLWSDFLNWDTSALPTTGDTAIIESGLTATVNVDVDALAAGTSDEIRVGDNTAGFLNVVTGGTVSTSSQLIVALSLGSGGSILTQSDGTANVGFGIVGWNDVGTYDMTGGTLNVTLGDLSLAKSAAANGSAFNQSGGTVNTDTLRVGDTGDGLYNISGTAALNVSSIMFVGTFTGSSGTLTQSGTSTVASPGIHLGEQAGTSGIYDLQGGTLTSATLVGTLGTGTFNQSGGTYNDTGTFIVGHLAQGSANLSGGITTAAADLFVSNAAGSAGSSVTQSGTSNLTVGNVPAGLGSLNVGQGDVGTYTMSGGTTTVADYINVSNLAGSAGSVFNMDGGNLTADNISVGQNEAGTYNQTGGTVTVNNNVTAFFSGLNVGNAGVGTVNHSGGTLNHQASHMVVGLFAGGAGSTYNLSGTGVVNVNNNGLLIIGENGAGIFNQTGGTVNMNANAVLVGRVAVGQYDMSGGDLNVNGAGNLLIASTNALTDGSTVNQSGGNIALNNGFVSVGDLFQGFYNMSGGTLTPNGAFGLTIANGADSAGSTFTQTGGTVNAPVNIFVGLNNQGNLNLSDTGSLNSGTNITVSVSPGSAGSNLDQSGGSLSAGGVLTVGSANAGSYDLSGGTASVGDDFNIAVGVAAGGSAYNQSGGSLTADQIKIGHGSAGIVNVTGGTLTAANVTAPEIAGLHVGFTNAGTVNQSAGTVDNTGNLSLGHFGLGIYNISGASVLNNNSGTLILALGGNAADGSTMDQSGGTVNAAATNVGRFGQANYNISGGVFNSGIMFVANSDNTSNVAAAGSQVTQTGGTVNLANELQVGVSAAASYSISAGDLNVVNTIRLATLNADGVSPSGVTFTQSGGNVITTNGRLQIGAPGSTSLAAPVYEISGGSLSFGDQMQIRDNGTFKVVGDTATIMDTISGGNGLSQRDGTIAFEFSTTGVSTIDISSSDLTRRSDLFGAATALSVDGTNYTGGPGVFPLIDYFALGGNDFGFGTVDVSGFALPASVVENLVDGRVDLRIVPEPGSVAILGIGCLGLLVTRKRRR